MKSKALTLKTLLIGVLLTAAVAGNAQLAMNTPAETGIRYLGAKDNMILFDVNLSALPANSLLRIFDGDGNLLFEDKIKSGSLHRRYKIIPEEIKKMKFEVINKGLLLKESFEINRYVEEKMEVVKA